MQTSADMRVLPILSLVVAVIPACTEPDRTPIITEIAVAPCGPDPARSDLQVIAQGTVVDFLTGAPLAGVTVDVARAWEPESAFPVDSCSLARFTTDAAGRFGPLSVDVGPAPSLFESKFIVFLAQGRDISPTASDNRVNLGEDTIDHTIAAPSYDLIDAWRDDLLDGGMGRARTRGLVAFRFDDAAGAPAAGVVATHETFLDSDVLARGDEVRYVSGDRGTLEPTSRGSTTESGLALIGLATNATGHVDIGGVRGADDWGSIGTLVGEGWLFLEWSRPINR